MRKQIIAVARKAYQEATAAAKRPPPQPPEQLL